MSLLSASNFVGIYSVLIGLMMIGMWVSLLLAKQVPELKPASYAPKLIAYHLIAEILTGIVLIVSGVGLFLGSDWSRILSAISLGMLLYSVINSPGKYAHENNLPMVAIFTIITILTVVAIITLFVLI
jgi:hypothetical protein